MHYEHKYKPLPPPAPPPAPRPTASADLPPAAHAVDGTSRGQARPGCSVLWLRSQSLGADIRPLVLSACPLALQCFASEHAPRVSAAAPAETNPSIYAALACTPTVTAGPLYPRAAAPPSAPLASGPAAAQPLSLVASSLFAKVNVARTLCGGQALESAKARHASSASLRGTLRCSSSSLLRLRRRSLCALSHRSLQASDRTICADGRVRNERHACDRPARVAVRFALRITRACVGERPTRSLAPPPKAMHACPRTSGSIPLLTAPCMCALLRAG